MFSSVSHMSLPSARNSRGPPKVPQGFSVRIFNAPKLSSYTYAPPAKLDLGYRPLAGLEPWQKQNWYSRPDTKRKSTPVPRDVPPRSSHFDINTTTDHSSYESNRTPSSNYSIYPSAANDTYIYQQSVCSKSDNYTDSETTSETFTPSSDVSTALTDDSTITLQTTTTETSTSHSSPPLPVRQPFPIQIPALEQAQAAVKHSTSGHPTLNHETLAAAARTSTASSSARGEPPAGGLDFSAVPLSWAIPLRRESPPTAQIRRDPSGRDSSTFFEASHTANQHLAPSHYPNGRGGSDERGDSGAAYAPSVPLHARVADSYTPPAREEHVGREAYHNMASRGLERKESNQVKRDPDGREPSTFDATIRSERNIPSFRAARREPDIRQEFRTVEPSPIDGRSPDGDPIPVGGGSGSVPRMLVEEQPRPPSQYPSRRDSAERPESHLRNASAYPPLRNHGYSSPSEEMSEVRKDNLFPSASRGPEERPSSARRDSDDRRRNSRGTWLSDGYIPSSGSGAVESIPRDQHAATSQNRDSSQPHKPTRRDSDESHGSHRDAPLGPPAVSVRGEPAYGGTRDAYSTSAMRISAERQESPRSYAPTRRNSDERQDFRVGPPSSDIRLSHETNATEGRLQESPVSYHPSRRDSDERRSHVVGPSVPSETYPPNGHTSSDERRVVASRVFVDSRESPTSSYPTSGAPDAYHLVSAPGETGIVGRREIHFHPEVEDFSELRELTQGGQPRGIPPRRHSGSQDSPLNTGELRSADSLHSIRRDSDDRLDSPSRAAPLSSSPLEYYPSNRQETRSSSNQTMPPTSTLSGRDASGSRPLSRSPPQPQRRSSDEVPGDIILGTQGVLSIKRNVRWNDNLICPSPILASQRRKGWYNSRGDQLWTNDGSYKPPSAGQEFPQDLSTYPDYGLGWMNEAGVRIDMHHRLIPKQPPRSALKRPQQISELDAGRNVFLDE